MALPAQLREFAADWNNDGTINDDLRDDLISGGFTLTYGNDIARVLFPPRAGTLSFALLNTDNKYFPKGGGSPGSNVKPGRTVRVQMRADAGADQFILFRGRTAELVPVMDRNQTKTLQVTALDGVADLIGKRVTLPVYEWRDTGFLIDKILDEVGWAAGARALDTGKTRIPMWWANNRDALELVAELLVAEGPPATFYYDPILHKLTFRNRHYRMLSASTSTRTFTDGGTPTASVANYKRLHYDLGWSRIVNDVTIETTEYTRAQLGVVGIGPNRIYKVDSTGTSHPTSIVIRFVLDEPADSIVAPVVDRDFVVISGSTPTVTVDQTSATNVAVTFTAFPLSGVTLFTGDIDVPQVFGVNPPADADAKLDTVGISPGEGVVNPVGANILKGKSYRGIQLRGRRISAVSRQQVVSSSTSSIDAYGKRSFPVQVPWISQREAEGYVTNVLNLFDTPTEVYGTEFAYGDGGDTQPILGVSINDRITVQSTEAGLNTPGHVEGATVSVHDAGHLVRSTVWISETTTTGTGSYLVLNSTANGILGTNTLAP